MSIVPLPADDEAVIRSERSARQRAGFGFSPEEEQQRRDQLQQQRFRDMQLEELDAALVEQENRARDLVASLRQAGLNREAEIARQRVRSVTSGAARQGLGTSSVMLQQQAQEQQRGQQAQEQVRAQSELDLQQQLSQQRQERDRLARSVMQQNPAMATADTLRTLGIQQDTEDQMRIAEAARQRRAAGIGRQAGIAGALGDTLLSTGSVLAAGIRGGS